MEGGVNMSKEHIYSRIYNDLKKQIESGVLQPGEKMDTEMEMRQRYGVSRESVRRALAMLENEGYITRKVSSGTFVRQKKAQYFPSSFHESFTEQMHRQGKVPSSDICSIEILTEAPQETSVSLQLTTRDKVYCIKRIRRADGIPMAYEIAYIRQDLCPNLHTLLVDDASLYRIYEEHYGLSMGNIQIKMEAVSADQSLQKLLGLKGSVAILKMTSLMYLTDGRPLYHVICYHIGDKYEFTTTMPRRP